MRRIVLSRLRLQWTRYVLILLAIAVSAAFATGSLMLGTTMQHSMVSTIADSTRNAALVVSEDWENSTYAETEETEATDPDDPETVYGADYVTTGDMNDLQDIDGVETVWASPSAGIDVETGEGSTNFLYLGTAPEDSQIFPWELDEGSMPRGDGEIALNTTQAEQLGVGVGDTLTLSPPSPEEQGISGAESYPTGEDAEVTVTGIVGAESSADTYNGWVSPEVMSTISPFDTDLLPLTSSAQIMLSDGADLETVRADIQDQLESLPGDTAFLVQTPQEQTEDALEDMAGAAAGLSAFLLAFAMLAVLVAFLVITTTFGVLTAQRARELALLRCLGATGGQIQRSVLLEALVLGLVSSAIGVAAVVGAGFALEPLLPATAPIDVAVALKDIVLGLVIGILVTVLASLGPARRAMGASPLDGMRGSRRAERIPWVRSGFGLLVLIPSVIALAWAAFTHDHPAVGVVSGIGAGVGLILTSRLWMPAIVGVLGRILPGGVPSRLAAANAIRHKSRTTTTATALLIGITLVTTVLTGHAVAQKSVLDDLDRSMPVDITVSQQVDQDTLQQIEDVDSVVSVEQTDDVVEVDLERGIGSTETTTAAQEIAELTDTEVYEIAANGMQKAMMVDILNVMLWVALGLLAAAVAVSVLGITSTMSLSVLERTRENSLLRALGLSRAQLGAMIRREALVISAAAGVAGAVAGWLLGTGVVSAMVTDTIPVAITVPWGGLLAVAIGVLVVALVSSALPARRATRVAPVEGLASLD
ncbi:ABC transporter permease [Kocuria sp. SL71]|uniref:ABC transporter permease n=1 Tax=Kocuria sp. SL71 TaxID=2995151 RepID=UPI0022724744|nr:ABC transporter permease [Kocuria sp. SL71]MCY1683061.1 FtsX-like permease family protein [Kocuria sp. SL71]